jgi:hypothetical protein
MHSIYRNSWLTISAACAKDISGGCFEGMSVPKHLQVDIRMGERESKPIYFRRTSPRYDCYFICRHPKYRYPWRGVNPLFLRSWVLQERLLSPRAIHFATREMIWECYSKAMCECTPDDIEIQSQSVKMLFHQNLSLDQTSNDVSSLSWQNLSKEYYSCRITYPEDRLPAISGLARTFYNSKLELRAYASGLWLSDLPKTLLWWCQFRNISYYVEMYHLKRHKASPSWSWVSIYGDIDKFTLEFALGNNRDRVRNSEIVAKVVSTKLIPKGSDIFGATEVGKITLELPFTSVQQGAEEYEDHPDGKRYMDTITSGSRTIPLWKPYDSKWSGEKDLFYHDVSFTLDCWETDSILPQVWDKKELSCVLVAKAELYCSWCLPATFHWQVLGLLLKPSRTHLGCYKRVGYVRAKEEFFSNTETRVITLV